MWISSTSRSALDLERQFGSDGNIHTGLCDVIRFLVATTFFRPPIGSCHPAIAFFSQFHGILPTIVRVVRLFLRLHCLDPAFRQCLTWKLLHHFEAELVDVEYGLLIANSIFRAYGATSSVHTFVVRSSFLIFR